VILVLWIHVLAAMVFLGGLLFQSHVFIPVVVSAVQKDPASRLVWLNVLRKFRRIAWIALSLVLLSGVYTLSRFPSPSLLFGASAGSFLAWKLALVILLIFLYAHRDFGLASRMMRVLEYGGDPLPLQRRMSRIDRVVLVLGVGALFFGLQLSRALY
jgi:uncharacterized membrane protein